MLKSFAIWFIEQLAIAFFGAGILLGALGPSGNPNFLGFWGEIYQGMVFVFFFYLASGFIISSAYFGVFFRYRNASIRAVLSGVIFVLHFVAFDFLIGGGKISNAFAVAILGALDVGIVTLVGDLVLPARKVDNAS